MKTKMNMKKIALGVLSVATIGIVASSGVVSAFQGDPTKEGPNHNADLHDLKTAAFDAQDYEVWKDLMEQQGSRGRVLDVVNEDNFNIFVEAHNAAESGDIERANELRAELGLNNGIGPKDGHSYGAGKGARDGSGSGQGFKRGNGLGRGTGQR